MFPPLQGFHSHEADDTGGFLGSAQHHGAQQQMQFIKALIATCAGRARSIALSKPEIFHAGEMSGPSLQKQGGIIEQ